MQSVWHATPLPSLDKDALHSVSRGRTVYALHSSTVDLCLSPFDWAPFRSTKAAVKLQMLLDLRGATPAFIHISDGKMHDVKVLDMFSFQTMRST